MSSQNVRSPKLRSPKELSPGIPRRPTAPCESRVSAANAESSRYVSSMPGSTGEHQVPCSTASPAASRQQRDCVKHQHATVTSTANRNHVALNSEKFARSQLQVTSVTCCRN